MNKYKIIGYGLLLISFIGCDNNSVNTNDQYYYPLEIGNKWEYRRDYVFYSYTDSTKTDTIEIITGNDSCSVFVIQELTLKDTINTIQLMEQAWEDTTIITGYYYYQERDTGLFEIAYQNPYLLALPKIANTIQILNEPLIPIHLKELIYEQPNVLNKTNGSSIFYEEIPVYVLKYPLVIGSHWQYRQENHPWRMDKEVIQDTTVTVSSGTFNCYHIRMSYVKSELNVAFDDFLSDEGLVLRIIHIYGKSVNDKNEMIYEQLIDKYELMNYDVSN